MPTYSYATGSTIESTRYSDIDTLLYKIPNNEANLINARDVRDSVFSLWEYSNDIYVLSLSAYNASPLYTNSKPTTATVGGIVAGSTFPTNKSMQEMFDLLLYPYVNPSLTLSATNIIREYGYPLTTNLYWSVTQKSNPIITININGYALPTSPLSGMYSTSGTYSTSPSINTINTFTMSVYDYDGMDGGITNITTNITWMNKIYWGSMDMSAIGNPNLTTTPSVIASASALVNSALILSLTGAGVSPGSQLATSKTKTYTNINGAGNYLIFAWPSNLPNAYIPNFIVNNLPNTAFTRLKTNWVMSNSYGFSTNYEVWITNTLQNSPLNITIN